MSEEQKEEVSTPEPVVEETITPEVTEEQESVEALRQRVENAKMENLRKTQEIQKLREELVRNNVPSSPVTQDPKEILNAWKDHELKALLKDPTNAHYHDAAEEVLAKRRFQRYQQEQADKQLRLNSELERQKKYPETFDPSHPMTARMSEIMIQHRLDNTPSGRLIAAELAHKEVMQKKAMEAGRKAEQNRQADVKASYTGGVTNRPAPQPSDTKKMQELKQKAMEGDPEARAEWFKLRGII